MITWVEKRGWGLGGKEEKTHHKRQQSTLKEGGKWMDMVGGGETGGGHCLQNSLVELIWGTVHVEEL